MNNEIWSTIPEIEFYSASSLGRIRGREIKKVSINPKGYAIVCLWVNGKSVTYQVHRLVATAFLPNPDNKPQINHINGNKSDNRVDNLEWCTPKENTQHALKTGLASTTGNRPLRKIAQIKNGVIIKIFNSTTEVKQAGFDRRAIYSAIKGTQGRHTHKGYSWKFLE